MKTISLLDTSINNYNLGNQIIMDSINEIIDDIFPDSFLFRMQASEKFGNTSKKHFKLSDFIFYGGTNALTSNINKEKYIGFSPYDLISFNRLSLVGVGWWQYQGKPNLYSRIFLKRLLDNQIIHSVRDSYTQHKLASIGIENVINTSCPTTWKLDQEHCRKIPKVKSDYAIFTLTDYNKNPSFDKSFIQTLKSTYSKIFFWPQGIGDLEYFSNIDIKMKNDIKILPPNLKSFDDLLQNEKIDYVGTRLHAGIRALQNKKRTLILSIDNRSSEISHDINLNTCKRGDKQKLDFFIKNEMPTNIKLPLNNINIWKSQFGHLQS